MRQLNVTVSEVLDVLEWLMISHGIFYYEKGEIPCCQSCGVYGVPKEYGNKYIFFNEQMVESAVNPSNGEIVYEFYMSWGDEVDFEIVRKAFEAANIVITGGNPSLKLMVRPEHLCA
jgi:hypothetical protein